MGITPAAAADIKADQMFPSLITKIELKDAGANSSTYFSIGRLNNVYLKLEPVTQMSSGKVPNIVGYNMTIEGECIISGTNARAAYNSLIQNDADTKITDVNGHTYSFTYDQFKIAIGLSIGTDFEGSIVCPITGGGYLTKAVFTSSFSATP